MSGEPLLTLEIHTQHSRQVRLCSQLDRDWMLPQASQQDSAAITWRRTSGRCPVNGPLHHHATARVLHGSVDKPKPTAQTQLERDQMKPLSKQLAGSKHRVSCTSNSRNEDHDNNIHRRHHQKVRTNTQPARRRRPNQAAEIAVTVRLSST